jgi:hypothetical protein
MFYFLNLCGPVAQRLEQGTHNPLVPGSNPGGPIPLASGSLAKLNRSAKLTLDVAYAALERVAE